MTAATAAIPKAFIWRRLHSLMGLWLVLFLCEHLLTNSQAALWLGDNGKGFVDMVNAIHNLPYLQVIELSLLGVPFLIHMFWGVRYLMTAKSNSGRTDGSSPHMPLRRNRAYTWQRITSWILLVCIIGHVAKFRFLEYPDKIQMGAETFYAVKVTVDPGLYTVADRLGVSLYDSGMIANERTALDARKSELALVEVAKGLKEETLDPLTGPVPQNFNNQKAIILSSAQNYLGKAAFVKALEKYHLSSGEAVATTKEFGSASLLTVRDTFKSPIYIGLYTIFVLAAVFHACNGFWTFLLTWGWVMKMAAQRAWTTVSFVLMAVLLFLGLAAIWGTYWINLRY
ncbi:MAG: succinate dehydrogenase [Verrucomicrobia bacterium]|nr:succinate dehydrogenase [Verrucomicrobiota bacterium]